MFRELLAYGPVMLVWAAVLYKLSALLRAPREPTLRFYWLTLFALALSLTTLLSPIYLAVDRFLGIPNLARLLAHSLMLISGWSAQMLLLHLNHPDALIQPRGRREGWFLVGTLALMAGLFWLADVPEESTDFTSRYAETRFVPEYRLVLLTYLGHMLANAARLSWRYARLTISRPSLHLGLSMVAIGATVGLGYVAHGALYLATRRLDIPYPLGNEEAISEMLLAGCVGLIVIGSTMPAWGPRLGIPALHQWVVRYRAYRRLYPLWHDLCLANPEIALLPPSGDFSDTLAIRSLGFRLYRRIVEIRDGHLALRPYFDPRITVHVNVLCKEARVEGEEADAVLEAVSIAVAIRAKERGIRGGCSGYSYRISGGANVQSEVAFLSRVAHHYTRATFVHAVLARLDEDHEKGRPRAHLRQGISPADRGEAGCSAEGVAAGRQRLARLVTELLAPTPTVSALLLVVAWHSADSATEALRWALLATLFASLIPFLYILRGVRLRRLTDIHVKKREQRFGPLLVGVASVAVGFVLLLVLGAPRDLVALVGAMAVGLSTSTLVTLFWKVSVHTAVNAGAVVILVLVYGPPLLVLAPLVALVGWARVEVNDHSPTQVVAGAILGGAVAAGVFTLLR